MRTVQLMGMMPAGVRHSILAMNGSYRFVDHIPSGVEFQALPAPPGLSFFGMGRYMSGILKDRRPDAVMTYNWGSIEMVLGAKRARFAPLIHHEDGFGKEESERYLLRRIWIRRWLLRHATAVAVPSRVLWNLAVSRWRVPEQRVHYLPNGLDLDRFRPAERGAQSPVVIGHVGHLRPEKNQQLLIEAFARSAAKTRARLRIYGDGSEETRLRQLVDALGISEAVEFMGAVSDTAPAYHAMDVFALSSRTEQMPLTVLEAMASGLPIVSTDVGDVRAMTAASNQPFITPKDDAAAFAVALDRLVEDAALRSAIGTDNRSRAESEFADRDRYAAWLAMYEQCGL